MENWTLNFYNSLDNHLILDPKFTLQQMDSKHVYKLFTVRVPITNEDGWCGAESKYISFKILLLTMSL